MHYTQFKWKIGFFSLAKLETEVGIIIVTRGHERVNVLRSIIDVEMSYVNSCFGY